MDDLKPLWESDHDGELVRLVRRGRALAVDYDVEQGLARHEQLAAQAASTSPGGGVQRLWWIALGGATCVIVLAWVLGGPSPSWISPPDPQGYASPTVAASPLQTPPIPATAEPIVEPPSAAPAVAGSTSEPQPDASPQRRRASAVRKSRATADAPRPAIEDGLEREAAQLRAIREALADGRAAAALRACDAGDAEFASGVFGLEREGLRALALFALDRVDEAERAAARYLAADPRGALATRIAAARASR